MDRPQSPACTEALKVAPSARVRRGAFQESEVRAILTAARPGELALIGLLCFTGMRPGEAYALRWLDLDLADGCARIARSGPHGPLAYRMVLPSML